VIFVDTRAWFAAAVASDRHHALASAFLASVPPGRLLTSDFVLDEALTLFKVRGANSYGVALGRRILEGTACGLERVTDGDLQAAFQVFSRFSDKGWSFTDCTSIVLMRRLGISQAMAFDAHFEQFGNVQVLPSRPRA
jgi:uncharacterized protein